MRQSGANLPEDVTFRDNAEEQAKRIQLKRRPFLGKLLYKHTAIRPNRTGAMMSASGEQREGLRCRPGDLARVVSAWNRALIGRTVLVGKIHRTSEWRITLLGEPGITLTKNRRRLGVGNNMLADDSQLEPMRGVMDGEDAIKDAIPLHRQDRSQGSLARAQ